MSSGDTVPHVLADQQGFTRHSHTVKGIVSKKSRAGDFLSPLVT